MLFLHFLKVVIKVGFDGIKDMSILTMEIVIERKVTQLICSF